MRGQTFRTLIGRATFLDAALRPERVTEELNAAGYALMETLQFLPRQYYLVFRKRDS